MKVDEIKNINQLINFYLIKVFSKKKNKDYYAIALKFGSEYIILCFLTETQKNAIIK